MGYRTVLKVPSNVRTYAQAKRIHDESKPIRGRDPEVRPLGARKDCDEYRVRMDGDVVQFVLYKTPVISYHPDGTVELMTQGWSTVSTHQMFIHVLGLSANGQRGNTVVTIGGVKHVIPQKKNPTDAEPTLKIRANPDTYKWEVVDSPAVMGYQINRTSSNNVRARFAEFRKYLKGFESLRSHEVQEDRSYYPRSQAPERTFHEVSCTVQELADTLGIGFAPSEAIKVVHFAPWVTLNKFPANHWTNFKGAKENFDRAADELFSLCANEQDESMKHTNFYKAAMVIFLAAHSASHWGHIPAEDKDMTKVITIRWSKGWMIKLFDDFLTKRFRAEVLEMVKLDGRVPNARYAVYMGEGR